MGERGRKGERIDHFQTSTEFISNAWLQVEGCSEILLSNKVTADVKKFL